MARPPSPEVIRISLWLDERALTPAAGVGHPNPGVQAVAWLAVVVGQQSIIAGAGIADGQRPTRRAGRRCGRRAVRLQGFSAAAMDAGMASGLLGMVLTVAAAAWVRRLRTGRGAPR